MNIRTRRFALQTGYNAVHDTLHGFVLALGERHHGGNCGPRYRFIVTFAWDWPYALWADENWTLNAPGYVRGLPIWRYGVASSAWTGRSYARSGWRWVRSLSCERYEDAA